MRGGNVLIRSRLMLDANDTEPRRTDSRSDSSREIGPKEVNEGAMSKKSLRAKAISVLRLGVSDSPALQRPLGDDPRWETAPD
jgi:hypothetical protein